MQTFDYQAYDAYCADQQYRILDICDSCQGEGHHGIDDVGCLYVCYACGGDWDYLCWQHGLPYGFFNKREAA